MNTDPATPSPEEPTPAGADAAAAPLEAEGGKSGEGAESALVEMKAMQKTRSEMTPGDGPAPALPDSPAT